MATYDPDLQAAVDTTSLAKDAGQVEDLAGFLRAQLAERGIETGDQEWLDMVVEGIRDDPNFMVATEPADYQPRQRTGTA